MDKENLNRGWLSRHKTKLILGTAAASTVVSVGLNPVKNVEKLVSQTEPWVGAGLVATEAAWIGGAALALSSLGRKVPKNPLQLHHKFSLVAESALNSKLFMTGLGVNTGAGIAQAAIATAGILELPEKSWGLLTLPAYDLALTSIRSVSTWRALKLASGPRD